MLLLDLKLFRLRFSS
uniref:Uncharacterized protein n=1 Tax=Rhizophora mucronata TaxID=61149 RepID=A0A2P2NLD0_RHIMU